MQIDSEYRNALSEGVLRLQEQGRLAVLKIKWWKEKKGGGACAVSYHLSQFYRWHAMQINIIINLLAIVANVKQRTPVKKVAPWPWAWQMSKAFSICW